MKKGFVGGILGAFFVIAILIFGYNALAGPKECPPGQKDNCSTFQQKQTGNIGCFSNNTNLGEGWEFVHSGCNDIDPASTNVPTEVKNFFPTPTIKSGTTATIVVPKFTPTLENNSNNDPKETPTPTLVLELQSNDGSCTNTCLCLIVTQLAVGNDLERTQIAVDLQNNSCPVPQK